MNPPDTRYTTLGDNRIAYQVLGEGSRDLVLSYGLFGHVDLAWEDASAARFLRRLASFSRLILFDPLGMGLSDARPRDGRNDWAHWNDELLAVMDAVRSEKAVILESWGTPSLELAAAHPERVAGLILWNSTARISAAPDYPEGFSPDALEKYTTFVQTHLGTDRYTLWANPSLAKNDHARVWNTKLVRALRSPKEVVELLRSQLAADARNVLPKIRAPTLVMHRAKGATNSPAQGRYLANHIAGAKYLEIPGADQEFVWEGADLILKHIREFVTGDRAGDEDERALLTVLFTDIVRSTERAAAVGDSAWRTLLDQHDRIVREQLSSFSGRLIESTGDGTLTTFGSPAKGIDCALALVQAVKPLGLELRAGLHHGEVELREDGRIGGLAVHFGARVAATARPGEVLVSHSVQGAMMGSRFTFEDRGLHELKGVPGRWPLDSVRQGP